jgi:hypothetical protein
MAALANSLRSGSRGATRDEALSADQVQRVPAADRAADLMPAAAGRPCSAYCSRRRLRCERHSLDGTIG